MHNHNTSSFKAVESRLTDAAFLFFARSVKQVLTCLSVAIELRMTISQPVIIHVAKLEWVKSHGGGEDILVLEEHSKSSMATISPAAISVTCPALSTSRRRPRVARSSCALAIP